MRILFFTTAPFNPGGPGKWFYGLFNKLDKQGHTTYVMTWGPKREVIYKHPRMFLIPYQKFLRVKYLRAFNFIQTMICASIMLRKIINQLSIDIVHSGGIYESFGAALGKGSCPLITTIHGDYITELKEFLKKPSYIQILKRYYSFMEFYAIRKTSVMTIPSLWLFKKLEDRIKGKYTVIIPNGVDIPTQRDKYPMRDFFHLEKEKLLFLVITNFNSLFRFKALVMLINALKHMKHLKKIKCVVLGKKQITINEQWDRLAMDEANGLPIEFRGFQKNVNDYLFASDVLLHPSFLDNQPLSILEAMACSRPVVASNVGGIPEIINNRKGGILLDNSVDLWAETIDNITEGIYDLDYIGEEGKKIIEQKFSWEIVVEQYENLYRHLIKNL